MGCPLPVSPQRVVGIGSAAGMVHSSTGYMGAMTFAGAPVVANAIVQYLGSERSISGFGIVFRSLERFATNRKETLMHFSTWYPVIGMDSYNLCYFFPISYFQTLSFCSCQQYF
ncbi:unnamed protein product [Fraxinus pennsylvanica]|uniref:Uncharacterized protein n=1 Tax=Fraxinus pennsylvanica TaxID=56036 RepID=A0AAD2A221_9LAMI|nr:unnamed protein product [Fraxinus pennsylvanica]